MVPWDKGKLGIFGDVSASGVQRSREACLALILLVSLLWLVSHPYQGIYHDALLYVAFAARSIAPIAYARDLLFFDNPQDQFSLFAKFYGLLAASIGLADAAKLIVFVGGLIWVIAVLYMSSIIVGQIWAVRLCAMLLISTTFVYSPNSATFSIHENFATARVLAIPLTTISVAATFGNRRWMAVATGLMATAMHPLYGIWALILVMVRRLSPPRLVALGASVVVAILSAHLFLSITSLNVMDSRWVAIVKASSVDVLPGTLGTLHLGEYLFWIGVLFLGGQHGNHQWRHQCSLLAIICAWAVLLSMVCSYFLPVKLVIQAQPWRVIWLAMLFGTAIVCWYAALAWHAGRSEFLIFCTIVAIGWASDWFRTLVPYAALVIMRSQRLHEAWTIMRHRIEDNKALLTIPLVILILGLLPNYYLGLQIDGETIHLPWIPLPAAVKGFFLAGGAGIGFASVAISMNVTWIRRLLIALCLPGCALAVSAWDARGIAHRELESSYRLEFANESLTSQQISLGQVVFWPEHPLETWFVLGAANYGDRLQAIGLVFSKARTEEVLRRLERISIAGRLTDTGDKAISIARDQLMADIQSQNGDPLNAHVYGKGMPTSAGIKYLCQDPGLDWVISPLVQIDAIAGQAMPRIRRTDKLFFRHDCEKIRAMSLAAGWMGSS